MNMTSADSEALKRIEVHEAVCDERYAQINARLKRLEMILMTTAGTSILLLLNLALKLK
jgi:hypothetical protein